MVASKSGITETPQRNTKVLIIGAGPTGLLAANDLVRRKIRCITIEKNERRSKFSKALGLHARTLETLDLMGIASRFMERGYPVTRSRLHFGIGEPNYLDFNQLDTAFPYVLVLPQSDTEEILENQLEEQGGVVERGSELVDIQTDEEGIVADIIRHGNRERISAAYALACDGAHSTVRKKLGISFIGDKENIIFFLADVKVEQVNTQGDMNFFMSNRGLMFLLPFKSGYTRVIVVDFAKQKRPHASHVPLKEIQDSVNHIAPGLVLSDPVWLAQFGTAHRMVSSYRHGNVFLIGDAAHIHNPAGGQGMNIGLQDVLNLTWKLELVLNKRAPLSVLDTYHSERRPIAAQVIKATRRVMHFATLSHPIVTRTRRVIGKGVTSFRFVRMFAAQRLAELKFHYRSSYLAKQHFDGRLSQRALQAGDRVPCVTLFAGEDPQLQLYSVMRQHTFTCLFYDAYLDKEKLSLLKSMAEQLRQQFGEYVAPYWVVQRGAPGMFQDELAILVDIRRELQTRWGLNTGGLIVLRQDGFVAFHQKD